MTTAYMLAVFKIDGARLEHIGTAIHYEREPDFGPGMISFVVLDANGEEEDDAREELLRIAGKFPRFEWALRSLVQR